MNYKETVEWLFTRTTVFQRDGATAYKPGLETIAALCESLGNPHKRLKCVHVAGTNGKGSTASTLASIFQSAGLKTALYTSPHLVDFRERIRINGSMIPEGEVVEFVEHWRNSGSELEPSFFELTTAMAFNWFARQKVDIAIIEVGLGGRLDSTNIITPLVSVITNISLDHTGLLGSTLAEIAAEKAGIIKPGVPVVIGYAPDPEVRAVFDAKAAEVGAPIEYAPEIKAVEREDGSWDYPDFRIYGALRGAFQPQNASTVLTALKYLPKVADADVRHGFAKVEVMTGLRGRLTEFAAKPVRILYDTGHNPGAWEYLGAELKRLKRPLTVVCGFAADKDVSSIMRKMPVDAHYIFCRPTGNRGLDAQELRLKARWLTGEVVPDVTLAVERAREITPDGGTIFIGGSNFVIADFLNGLRPCGN